jgi:hypothetical protein
MAHLRRHRTCPSVAYVLRRGRQAEGDDLSEEEQWGWLLLSAKRFAEEGVPLAKEFAEFIESGLNPTDQATLAVTKVAALTAIGMRETGASRMAAETTLVRATTVASGFRAYLASRDADPNLQVRTPPAGRGWAAATRPPGVGA